MKTYAKGLEKVLGVGVNVELTGLGLGDVESGDLRNVLILALTLLLLQLEGDTADGATLDTAHPVVVWLAVVFFLRSFLHRC